MNEIEELDRKANRLLDDIRNLINAGRVTVARTVNRELITLYWNVEYRIRRQIVPVVRAEYGKKIMEGLAERLRRRARITASQLPP